MTRRISLPAGLTGHAWAQVVRVHYRAGDAYDAHDHEFAELFWIESGTAGHLVHGQRQALPAGTVVLMRPRDAHAFDTADGAFVMVNVTFRREILDHLRRRYGACLDPWPWGDAAGPTIRRLRPADMERLQEWADALAGDQSLLTAEGFLLDLLRLLRGAPAPGGAPPWLTHAIERLGEADHLAAGPAAFCRLCGRTPAHVNRVVREVFATTTTELVNGIRLAAAAHALRLSERSIAEIAGDCGFASLAHFYRSFSARFGATPRAFRHGHQAVGRLVPEQFRPGTAVPVTNPRPPSR